MWRSVSPAGQATPQALPAWARSAPRSPPPPLGLCNLLASGRPPAAGEDQPLLAWRDALLNLDLPLDVLNRVAALDLECDDLASRQVAARPDEDLHPTLATALGGASRRQLLLDIVIGQLKV